MFPKIIPQRNTADHIVELLSWLTLFGIWILVLTSYTKLPETIPIHFDISGSVDAFGHKKYIFSLPIFASLIFCGFCCFSFFHKLLRVPSDTHTDAGALLYVRTMRIIRLLKLLSTFIFTLITYKTVQISYGNTPSLGLWLFPSALFLIATPIVTYLITATRLKLLNEY